MFDDQEEDTEFTRKRRKKEADQQIKKQEADNPFAAGIVPEKASSFVDNFTGADKKKKKK